MTAATMIASIYADEALEDAEAFERDLSIAQMHAPDDFSPMERAALELLMRAAVARVKLRRVAAGMEVKEEV